MQGVGVQSYVLEHVADSSQSVPSGGSSASVARKERDKALLAGTPTTTAAQLVGGSKVRKKGFPPLVPKSQPASTDVAATLLVTATGNVEGGEDDTAQLAHGNPRSSEVATEAQLSRKQAEYATGKSSGGRRWFRMFGSPAKPGGAESANDTSDMKHRDSSGAALTPQPMAVIPGVGLQQATERHQSDPVSLAGSGGSGQAHELARLSSEAAQRRVGPHAVFNPITMMNPGDAKFLDGVQVMRREGLVGPEATSTSPAPSGALLKASEDPEPTGGNSTILQSRIQPQVMLPSSGGSQRVAQPVAAAAQAPVHAVASHQKSVSAASIDSGRSPTDKSSGSRSGRSGLLEDSSGCEIATAARHFFKT